MQTAWHRLLEKSCNPHILKSALYHAARETWVAQDTRRAMKTLLQIREEIFGQLTELRKQIRSLTSIKAGTESLQLFRFLLGLQRVRREHIVFFMTFPKLLERFEAVLAIPKNFLGTHTKREPDEFFASAEAPLHIYLEEVTGRPCFPQTAHLLEAAVSPYCPEHKPSYSLDAVYKRYRRFKSRAGRWEVERRLVKGFIREAPKSDLHTFISRRNFELSYNVVMDYLDDVPTIGVEISVAPDNAKFFRLIVSYVTPDSPAAKAGLRIGDVITQLDGKPITGAGKLTRLLREKSPGDTVHLDVMRDDKPTRVAVMLRGRSCIRA
jgi:hypothetical protein